MRRFVNVRRGFAFVRRTSVRSVLRWIVRLLLTVVRAAIFVRSLRVVRAVALVRAPQSVLLVVVLGLQTGRHPLSVVNARGLVVLVLMTPLVRDGQLCSPVRPRL